MLAHGNGTRQQCAANLVRTVRGEVPFERSKGIDRSIFDAPAIDRNRIQTDVGKLIGTFEPRVDSCTVSVVSDEARDGAFSIQLAIE